MKAFISTIILFASASIVSAGENCMYVGEDVGSIKGPHAEAVRICSDGEVTVTKGALVPGLLDLQGHEVRVKDVKTLKAPPAQPPAVIPISSLAEAAKVAAAQWHVSIPVRAIRYGETSGECKLENGRLVTSQIALTDPWTKVITVNAACPWNLPDSDALLAAVLTHEMGHILMGPEHSADSQSIMFATVSSSGQAITPLDRQRLAEQSKLMAFGSEN
jgi:hypothetical protein